MSHINIRSLAKELQLSIGTVSKALKDSHEISAATKLRVLELAQKLQYNPNPYASSLRRKKSNTIAVVLPEVADSFFSVAIKGIEEVAQENGFHVLIYLTFERYLKEKKILEAFRNGRVDGILMSVSSETMDTAHIEALWENNIPVVFFDRVISELPSAKITTNDEDISFEATSHLVARGCQEIVYLSISKHLAINNRRIAGFQKALQAHELPCSAGQVIDCSNDETDNDRLIRQLLLQAGRPDGIIAGVEKLVMPVYAISKELHIDIPAHLKIVGFSNSPLAPILNPSLTTVTQPAYEMCKRAAAVLFRAMLKKGFVPEHETVILSSTLLPRDSTGCLS